MPEITINSDGTITPETGYISRAGNVYTLTADIIEEYSIDILCSNIVFDGAGHTINTTEGENAALALTDVANVKVKNIEVFSRYTSIYLYYSSNCLLTDVKTNYRIYLTDGSNSNTITNSTIQILHIGLGNANNNLVIKNNILRELGVSGSNNCFSQNNFFLDDLHLISGDNFWDNGSIGNYWGNYSVKYPNASEIGNTGIGDTPYGIDANNADKYPLMYPYDIEKGTIVFPTPEPTPTPEPEPFPTTLVATVSAASVAVIGAGLLVYFKKRNH